MWLQLNYYQIFSTFILVSMVSNMYHFSHTDRVNIEVTVNTGLQHPVVYETIDNRDSIWIGNVIYEYYARSASLYTTSVLLPSG